MYFLKFLITKSKRRLSKCNVPVSLMDKFCKRRVTDMATKLQRKEERGKVIAKL